MLTAVRPLSLARNIKERQQLEAAARLRLRAERDRQLELNAARREHDVLALAVQYCLAKIVAQLLDRFREHDMHGKPLAARLHLSSVYLIHRYRKNIGVIAPLVTFHAT